MQGDHRGREGLAYLRELGKALLRWHLRWILRDKRNLTSTKEGGKNSDCKDTASLKTACLYSGIERWFWGLWSGVCCQQHQGISLKKGSGQTAGVWTLPYGQWRTTRDYEQGGSAMITSTSSEESTMHGEEGCQED